MYHLHELVACSTLACSAVVLYLVLSQFVINVAFCNKTVAFSNKKPDAFCSNFPWHFVIK